MVLKFNLIVAVCENMGIGKDGKLPWKLKSEMAYFARMTATTKDPEKQNVVLMGRTTWDCIPLKFRPLKNRINMVLSRNHNFKIEDSSVIVRNSLESAVDTLSQPEYQNKIESIWVIGGSYLYNDVMQSKYFHRLYLTEIKAHFDCDTFMPALSDSLKIVQDPEVPTDTQEENGTKFVYKIYENTKFNSI